MDHHKAAHAMHKAMDSIAVALDGLREARRQPPTAIADQLGLLSQQATDYGKVWAKRFTD